jgi:endonuclease G
MKNYHRRGFRLRGNTLVLLFVFFLIGLFLHYGGRSQPVVAFWNDVRALVGLGPARHERVGDNPYKAPEPTNGGNGTSNRRSDSESEASDNRGSASVPIPNSGSKTLFDFEKRPGFILPAHKTSDEIIEHSGYTLRFRDQYKVADWVAYPLLPEEINGDTEREGSRFVPDPAVSTGSALPADYTRSGYDRGHLAPAGDFKFSRKMMQETFFMSNMTPQTPEFNRGIWKELEGQVREWALRDQGLYVITGPVLKPGLPTIGKTNEVSVPEKFYKVLLYCDRPNIRMIGFLLDNQGSDQPLTSFVVPVSQIERLTGITFFPFIPADMAQRLKNQSRSTMVAEWFR